MTIFHGFNVNMTFGGCNCGNGFNPFFNAFNFFRPMNFGLPFFNIFGFNNVARPVVPQYPMGQNGVVTAQTYNYGAVQGQYNNGVPSQQLPNGAITVGNVPRYTGYQSLMSNTWYHSMGLEISAKSAAKPADNTSTVNNPSRVDGKDNAGNNASATDNKGLFTDSPIEIKKVSRAGMSYILIAPKDIQPNEKLPLLVYLHGSGQMGDGCSFSNYDKHIYDPSVIMRNLKVKHFRGYILCPLSPTSWSKQERNLRQLYDEFKSTHNVDTSKVAVAGASAGGAGTLYMANAMSDVFKKAAAFSPYNPGNLSSSMKIPTKAFVGSRDDGGSINFTNSRLKGVIGSQNITVMNGQTHNSTPGAVFNMDNDRNGCSDLLEWLFS